MSYANLIWNQLIPKVQCYCFDYCFAAWTDSPVQSYSISHQCIWTDTARFITFCICCVFRKTI